MDVLKTATEWSKAEMLSSSVFIFFGLIFLIASLSFWQLGKTDVAKAYIIPMLVVGTLLMILGVGLVASVQWRASGFSTALEADASAFVAAEILRAEKTIDGYKTAVFLVMPVIIAISAVLIIFLNSPLWRASLISIIAMMAVIIFVDSNASARLEAYKSKLQQAQ